MANLYDGTGELELVWFQGIKLDTENIACWQKIPRFWKGRLLYECNPQITHPEIEEVTDANTETKFFLEPVYPSTEKLKARDLGDGK